MHLRKALSVLSKSSPYSVSTLRTGVPDQQQRSKDYLYVTSDIDTEFNAGLENSQEGDLLFLCGSSGDGKSEILTKACKDPNFSHIKFHLDATHSKTQHGSAIDCLDNLFDEYNSSGFTLAVGINIGMMQKFIKFGSEKHQNIKDHLEKFLQNRHIKGFKTGKASFYDFESYPRVSFENEEISSAFIKKFLDKLTAPENGNPFWEAYIKDESLGHSHAQNFKLLSDDRIKKGIVNLVGSIRLYDEQFLVPRTFVDFIYKLITTDNSDGLIGNLFSNLDNDISLKICSHDPIKKRSRYLDDFLLSKATKSLNQETIDCSYYLNTISGINLSNYGLIRLASIVSDSIAEKFPASLLSRIHCNSIQSKYLSLHRIFKLDLISESNEDILSEIIDDSFLPSVIKYINRSAPIDLNGYIICRDLDGFFVCNKLEIYLDIEEIENSKSVNPEFLTLPFIINDKNTISLDLDINLLSLVERIKSGFLPNRNLLNSYAKLDEFIRDIILASSKSEEVKVYKKDELDIFYAEARKGNRGYTLKGACSVK
ncbi:DNA phosphorothioation-dependent restriction protein DptF [Neptuniibacter sp. PT8_73]|uniref:DNA phosphorothioation-dependent restriction protein DptF n=1 Tax=Neptuniibacter sp. PT8_73 TaxID=3398206 RepID=UPI0039F47134